MNLVHVPVKYDHLCNFNMCGATIWNNDNTCEIWPINFSVGGQ